ncbi:MAG TPA: type IV secretory system conjugative DNA transfer family protein [Daejeonella sp.]
MFNVTAEEMQLLFEQRSNPENRTKIILWLVTVFLTPVTLIGSLFGYARAYNRFMLPKDESPSFYPMRPVVRVAMIMGAVLIWLLLIFIMFLIVEFMPLNWIRNGTILWYIGINIFLGGITFAVFRRWRDGVNNALIEGKRFGSARFARQDELAPYLPAKGFYIGGGYSFSDKGHILTVAGTRGGKGTNLIIPNLLGASDYSGSWVVIDPKGENAAITARYQRERGQNVVILNPWGLLADRLGEPQSYNPLDILADKDNIHLVDDAQMIAEMIVPIDKNDRNKFFTDNARAIVSGLLLHMATYEDEPIERSLKTLWQWVRLPEDKWLKLIEDMNVNDNAAFGDTVKEAANEIEKLMKAGDKTWGNIIATVLQCTDFIKSPALQKSMATGFDPKTLSDGKTTVYVIIPADKLQSHARWLRLVTTTTMRAVVRKPNKRVCFLLDEFAALGYLPEIETALSTYAGFEITVWPILQSLIQLHSHYKDNWETFVGNSTVRQFFSVNDNFTAEYVSKAIGQTSHVINQRSILGIEKSESNSRALVTPDELRRASGENIFAFISDKAVTYFSKLPYYHMLQSYDNSKARYDDNPYYN